MPSVSSWVEMKEPPGNNRRSPLESAYIQDADTISETPFRRQATTGNALKGKLQSRSGVSFEKSRWVTENLSSCVGL